MSIQYSVLSTCYLLPDGNVDQNRRVRAGRTACLVTEIPQFDPPQCAVRPDKAAAVAGDSIVRDDFHRSGHDSSVEFVFYVSDEVRGGRKVYW